MTVILSNHHCLYQTRSDSSFFATLKVEFYYQKPHCGGIATKHEVGEWISFYNQTRFHSTLGYITPAQAWTDRMAASHTLAA